MGRDPDSSRKRGRVLSPEEAALFDATMRDVKALSGRAAPPSAAMDSGRPPPPRPRAAAVPRSPVRLPPLSSGESADVDTRTLERLRRGQLRPTARLDLHGMTQGDAHPALVSFIGRAQARGARCILVVTGKGRLSEGGGVLRNRVPQWLNSPAIRPRILAFASAQPRDGGAGALYVLLRRTREPAVRE